MKKISVLLIIFLCSLNAYAGFTIKGEIKNYENRNLLFSYYSELGVPVYLANAITDESGKFELKIKENYQGVIQMEMEGHGGLKFYSSGKEDIIFSSLYNVTNEELGQVEFSEGSSNHLLSNFEKTQELKEVVLPQLSQLITKYKPADHFYSEIEKEINRINNLKGATVQGNASLAKYQEINQWTADYSNLLQKDILNAGKELKKNLLDDSFALENNGQLGNLIYSLISYYTYGAQTKEEFEGRIKDSIIQLDQLVERTTRYQNIVGSYIQILNVNGLNELGDDVLKYYESKDFKKSGLLKDMIDKKISLKEGTQIPDFSFESNQGNKKLYKVKSKYKVVLFWASWCPACRQELPDVIANYPKFKEMGGEIISFALDISPSEYVSVSKDFPWISSCDYKKWYSPVVELFNVEGTPKLVLLDENNKIISTGNHWNDLKIVPKMEVSTESIEVN